MGCLATDQASYREASIGSLFMKISIGTYRGELNWNQES